jgi:hypothetical protein
MRKLPLLLVVVAVVVAACTGSSDEDEGTTTTAAAAPSTSEEETTTAEAPETTTTTEVETTTTTTSGEAASGTDDCLVGTWTLDTEAFVENFEPLFADAGIPDADVSALDGDFIVELGADESLTGTRDEWGFDIDTGQGVVTLEINGTETGTWSADGSTMTVSIDESDVTVNSSIEVDGQVIEMPQDQIPVETPPGIASNSEYTCSGDVLTLTNEGIETVLNRS